MAQKNMPFPEKRLMCILASSTIKTQIAAAAGKGAGLWLKDEEETQQHPALDAQVRLPPQEKEKAEFQITIPALPEVQFQWTREEITVTSHDETKPVIQASKKEYTSKSEVAQGELCMLRDPDTKEIRLSLKN